MDIRRRFLSKNKSGGSSGGDSSGTYTVNLNSQWEKTTAVTNPDSSLYDGVYRSTSNYNVHNTAAIMYIDISGLTSFKLYIRSYAESNYDYVMVSQLDQTINNSTSYSSTSLVKAHTRGNQQSGTALSSYTLVEFTGIDGGSHRITVVYRKDGSANSGDDRGYVVIPKSQESGGDSGGGDVDIDTTYSIMYTSSDGNVVTPYSTTAFGANITSNTYVNGQGIITFDGPVTNIGAYAFNNCTSLTSITIPDNVTSIGYSAFNNCTSLPVIDGIRYADTYLITVIDKTLSSYTIRSGTRFIGSSAFENCKSLTSITIPDSVISIGASAFRKCPLTGNFTVWDNLQKIGEHAFNGSRFEKIFVNSIYKWFSVISGYGPFMYSYYYTKGFYVNNVLLEHVVIPEDITIIPDSAFYQFTCIKNVTIPNSVTKIGNSVFTHCDGLTSITIPDSVTDIGAQAFIDCFSLESITLSSSLLTIRSSAFSSCYKLKDVYCKATTPPTGGSSMFYNTASNLTIYVPTASVNAYKSAQYWSNYADYIVGYDFEDDGGGSSELITFTIAGTEYQAEEGMTWGEWIDSEYNVISAFVSAMNTVSCGNSNILTSTYNSISSNELILHGESYIIGSHTGGGGN